MLLHRQPRGGTIPREKLLQRFERFSSGQRIELIRNCVVHEEEALKIARRRSRRQGQDGVVKRAERADQLVHLGELSSAKTWSSSWTVTDSNAMSRQALQE